METPRTNAPRSIVWTDRSTRSSVVGVSLCLLLSTGLLSSCVPSGNSSISGVVRTRTRAFATPEAAIEHLVQSLASADLAAAMEACAIDEPARNFDLLAYAKRYPAIQPHDMSPTDYPMYQEINRIHRVSLLAGQARMLIYSLCQEDDRLQTLIGRGYVYLDEDGADAAAFIQSIDPGKLSALKIRRIDAPAAMSPQQAQQEFADSAQIFGGTEITERVILYELNGRLFVGGFRLIRYGEDWKVLQLSSDTTGFSPMGMASSTTEEEYLHLME